VCALALACMRVCKIIMFSKPRMIILLFLVFYFLENAVHMCNDVSLMLLFNLFANLSQIFLFNLHMESQ
jgi:hypothetical protein